jgi:hypothetical protein
MANWINGNNIFGFKALISHDGMFNTVDLAFTTDVRSSHGYLPGRS